jgi:dienelactone hydrolase
MRISLGLGLTAAVAVATVLGIAGPCRAQDLAWLGGDTVQIAVHRTGLTPSGQPNTPALVGYLARPRQPGRHPAVVILHDCSGFGIYYPVIADVLKSYGYVALALDSLGDTNACLELGAGAAAEASDAYLALDWLARQNFVDPSHIALLGFSMGGSATLDSIEAGPSEEKQSPHFRAAIAYYPECKDRTGMMAVPTLILVGDKDDWTPASLCRDMMARRNGKGAAVTLVVYPGATHVFNFAYPTRDYLGHHLVYDPQATAAAWRQVRDFLQARLGEAKAGEGKRERGTVGEVH